MGLYKLIKNPDARTIIEKVESIVLLLSETKELDQIIHGIVERSIGKE
jgi:hypothetical protein